MGSASREMRERAAAPCGAPAPPKAISYPCTMVRSEHARSGGAQCPMLPMPYMHGATPQNSADAGSPVFGLILWHRQRSSLLPYLHPMRAIEVDVRRTVVDAWRSTASIRAAATAAGVSYAAAWRWISRFRTTRRVDEKRRPGPKRVLSTAAVDTGRKLLLSGTWSGAGAISRELHRRGLASKVVHSSTLICAVKAAAATSGSPIRAYRGKPIKELSASTLAKRLAFAKANRRTHWRSVVFSDRKKFMFWYPGSMVQRVTWCRKGTRPVAKVSSHPMALNVYAALTAKGLTAVHVVAGTSKHSSTFTTKQGKSARNITAAEYQCVLTQTLLPGAQLKVGTCYTFQQDNDPTHRSAPEIVQAYNKAHGTSISVLPKWPPNSPDLNPIENVWSMVQGAVNARACSTFEEFKAAVIQELQALAKTKIASLYKSMPSRMQKVISSHGDRIRY